MTLKEAYDLIKGNMEPIYGNREAAAIATLIMEFITGLTRSAFIIDKSRQMTKAQEENLQKALSQLKAHWPVQYVTGEAWFAGMKFFVDQRVLIPRPETEELVEWMVKDILEANGNAETMILDIGTGSGCIPIALQKKLPRAKVYGLDISYNALDVAKLNAARLNTAVNFMEVDITDSTQWEDLPVFDYIVSNPPYIPEAEKSTIPANVLEHEPHLALFVHDFDPLYYYRMIFEFSEKHLRTGGSIYFEIHENFAGDILHWMHNEKVSSVEVRKDLQGRDRMIKVVPGSISL
jgi:release factor glutamine methyltransferase